MNYANVPKCTYNNMTFIIFCNWSCPQSIFCLNNSNSKDKKWLIKSIKNHNKNKKRVKEIISFVNKNGGIEYAKEKMEEFKLKAVKILKSFSKNKYRDSLEMTINYVISRNQ